jgi:leucyl aminopeptidase (aminopeptidase T)
MIGSDKIDIDGVKARTAARVPVMRKGEWA